MTDQTTTKKDLNELLPSNILSEIKLEDGEEDKSLDENEDEIIDVYTLFIIPYRTLLIKRNPLQRNTLTLIFLQLVFTQTLLPRWYSYHRE